MMVWDNIRDEADEIEAQEVRDKYQASLWTGVLVGLALTLVLTGAILTVIKVAMRGQL